MQNTAALSVPIHARRDKFDRSIQFWTFALTASGLLGIFSGVTGLLIDLFFLLEPTENKGLMSFLSVGLLVAAFLMLWLAAHCLDRLGALDKARRIDNCSQHGLIKDAETPEADQ